MASCADNSPSITNVEDSSTINAVKEEAGGSSANADTIPGVNNGGTTVSGSTGGASPGSGVSLPAATDSTSNKKDSSKQ